MLSKNQVSNLITYYNEQANVIKHYGTDDEYENFCDTMDKVFECIEVEPYFEEDHLVDLKDLVEF